MAEAACRGKVSPQEAKFVENEIAKHIRREKALCKRLFPEDGSSFIREIKHIFYRLPLLQPREHILPTTFTVGRFWEYYRQVLLAKMPKKRFLVV
mgnify:CR=1 FL=1